MKTSHTYTICLFFCLAALFSCVKTEEAEKTIYDNFEHIDPDNGETRLLSIYRRSSVNYVSEQIAGEIEIQLISDTAFESDTVRVFNNPLSIHGVLNGDELDVTYNYFEKEDTTILDSQYNYIFIRK